jgi:hypothetical protein
MELEKLEADFEERRKNAIAATENAAGIRFAEHRGLPGQIRGVTREKNKVEEELQQSAARWNARAFGTKNPQPAPLRRCVKP